MKAYTKIALSLHAACFALCLAAFARAAPATGPANNPMKLAREMEKLGQNLEARFYYGQALMRDPRDKAALSAVGLLEVRMGETESARVHLGRLQRICPDCTETARLAQALARSPQVGRAESPQERPE
jgi:Flp pilus assembly protein TadD